jgi:adenylylsulfate kinase
MSENTVWHPNKVTAKNREDLLLHRSACLWFTGLSGSGKSTIAAELEYRLYQRNVLAYILDGDNIRQGLNRDLDFSPEGRRENIRRISEVAKLIVDAGLVVMTAFISPYREDRDRAREIIGSDRFVEVFVDADLDVCERRDPKGLYKKARAGEIGNFTGVSAPYEPPVSPDITLVNDDRSDVGTHVETIIGYLNDRAIA